MSSTLGCTASARAMHRRCCWPPDSAPPGWCRRSRTSRHSPARSSDCSTSPSLSWQPRRASLRPGEHVVADVHGRERVRLLEHHADAHADLLGAGAGRVDVLAVEPDLPGERGARHQLVHAVEQPQEGGLAAARRPDERGDLAGRHVQVDALEHEVVAEPGAGVDGLERRRTGRWPALEVDAVRHGCHVGRGSGRRGRSWCASWEGPQDWRADVAERRRARGRAGATVATDEARQGEQRRAPSSSARAPRWPRAGW